MNVVVSIKVLERYARLLVIRAWNNIQRRTGDDGQASYANVEVRMTRREFDDWAIPAFVEWFMTQGDDFPSIDRIDPNGHYELANIRLMELSENRTTNKRNKNQFADEGTLHCYGCSQYLPKENFYTASTIPESKRNHWSSLCKSCTKRKNQRERPIPTGVCERCGKALQPTDRGKVSRAKHCGSCRQRLWQEAHPECLARSPDYNRIKSSERTRRYRERLKVKTA